jgi:hypothetical protein
MRVLVAMLLCGASFACGTVNSSSPDAGPGGDSPDGPVSGPGSGALRFSDATYAFGDMTVGQSSLPFSARVINAGTGPVGPLSLHLAGANPDDFAVDAPACSTHTLGTGTDCAVTLTFAPKAAGARTAELVVEAGTASATLTVTGNALAPGALSIAPSPQQFDDTAIGASSPEVEFTITNTGDTALDAPALTSGDGSFVITPAACPDRLGPHDACKVKVAFRPVAGGSRTTSLTARSGDQAGIAAIRGTGHGTLTVTRAGEASASGTVTGGTVNCGTTCTVTVAESTVLLTAATTGTTTRFDGWSPICGTAATCEVPIDAATRTVAASFSTIRHSLGVSTSGTAGSITADGLDCSGTTGTCTKSYVHGSPVQLTANAGADSTFDHWTGACAGVNSVTCNLTIDGDKSVGAVFKVVYTLTVRLTGPLIGVQVNVSGMPPCKRAACQYLYNTPTSVTLDADSSGDSAFQSWTGNGCTTGNCRFTVDANKTATANFKATGNVTAPTPTR